MGIEGSCAARAPQAVAKPVVSALPQTWAPHSAEQAGFLGNAAAVFLQPITHALTYPHLVPGAGKGAAAYGQL